MKRVWILRKFSSGESPVIAGCLQGLGCGSQHESLFRSLRPRGTRWVGSNVVWSLPRKRLAYIEPKLRKKYKQHFLRIGWWKEKLHGEKFKLSCSIPFFWVVGSWTVGMLRQQLSKKPDNSAKGLIRQAEAEAEVERGSWSSKFDGQISKITFSKWCTWYMK